jgi:hypothetical protein
MIGQTNAGARAPGRGDAAAGAQLLHLISSSVASRAICATARLGLADVAGSRTMTLRELAREIGADEERLGRLIRALVGTGVCARDAAGAVRFTRMGCALRADAPMSVRQFALDWEQRNEPGMWGNLADAILTGGEAAMEARRRFFEQIAGRPAELAAFHEGMDAATRRVAPAILSAYDFGGHDLVVDVGGGSGEFARLILEAVPGLRAVSLDLPAVCLLSAPPADPERRSRYAVVGADFTRCVPVSADCIVIKGVLHDWDDETASRILRNCCLALRGRNATILAIELVVPRGNAPHVSKFVDLDIMATTQCGRERTLGEFRALSTRSGLRLTRLLPTGSPFSIMQLRKAPDVRRRQDD